jgi:gas vesicle protein
MVYVNLSRLLIINGEIMKNRGLIAGTLAGVVGALLLAPKAGKDTRDLVRRKSSEYISTMREKLQKRKSSTDGSDPRR